ncbi:HD domain-containing protein [Winogradskyella sp. 3972H.M.0a.05]|uniref:HD domain-containing protein n=1 Tax=Winogradskyella sp. 3972H.M.0a.05 TaxID=2950277 RepID=UPI00339618EE
MKTPFKIILKDITKLLDTKLPDYLTYHDTAHTLYVLDKSIHIAKKEGVGTSDLELLKVAALFHDIGFTVTHKEHEEEGCKIAKTELKKYGYSNSEIETICGMIMATKIPQRPKTLLEQILADADLEYLATSGFSRKAKDLYKERLHFNPDLSLDEWNEVQIEFMKNHRYHTKYCKHYKTFRKQRNLKQILRT